MATRCSNYVAEIFISKLWVKDKFNFVLCDDYPSQQLSEAWYLLVKYSSYPTRKQQRCYKLAINNFQLSEQFLGSPVKMF